MNIFDNVKGKVTNEYKKQQQKAADRKAEKAEQLALEEAKHKKILAGQLDPITVSVNLQPDEEAYLELTARRMAAVDSIVQETTGTTKKKHVIRRTVVGGVLTFPVAPVGMLAGAATAGSKSKSVTTQKTISSIQLVDSGPMLLTSKRFIFLGNNNIVSLPYEEIVAVNFSGNQVTIKYAGMLNGEHYEVFGSEAKDVQLYYKGVTRNLSAAVR